MPQLELSLGVLRELNMLSIFVRFALAVIFGGLIGVERGKKRHAAGLRTHLLVCIGAASIMMLSQYLLLFYQSGDPMRLGAQVISGIGFLGVGTIVVTGRSQVRGLTTAAGLWACACMGLAIGSGFYEGAVIMCIFIYIVLEVLNRVDDQYIKSSNTMLIYTEFFNTMKFSRVLEVLRAHGWSISNAERLGVETDQSISMLLTVCCEGKRQDDAALMLALRSLNGMIDVEPM